MGRHIIDIRLWFTLLALLMACGGGGTKNDGGGNGSDDEENPSPVLAKLTANVFENSADVPAAGYAAVLQHEQSGRVQFATVDPLGLLDMDLKWLAKGQSYSIHLLDANFNWLSPIYFEGASIFRWNGDDGFELGELLVTRDIFGLVDPARSNLAAEFTSSITPISGADSVLGEASANIFGATVNFGGELLSFQPAGSLYGQYLRESYPKAHSAEHLERSRVFLHVESGSVKSASLHMAGRWTGAARWAVNADASRTGSTLWKMRNGYALEIAGDEGLSASVFPGIRVGAQAVALLSLATEADSAVIARRIKNQVSIPPLLYAIGQNATPSVINYANAAAENGLTRPFCRTVGDVFMDFEWPVNMAGIALSARDVPFIAIDFRYYTKGASGVVTRSAVSVSDFPAGYQQDITEVITGVGTLKWQPGSNRATYDIVDQSGSRAELTIPAELLLSTVASSGLSVDRIELRITFYGAGVRAGNLVIIRNCS